jgi:hypothetical protein
MKTAVVLTKSNCLIRFVEGKKVSEVYPKDDQRMQLAIKRAIDAGYKVFN